MKIKDVRELETKKLHERLSEARAKLVKVRFGVANKEAKNVRDLRKLREDISKFLTVLNERRHAKADDTNTKTEENQPKAEEKVETSK